jgi:hypothetical protein
MCNKGEIKGKGKQISAAIKDKAGKLIGNPNLEAKGKAERVRRPKLLPANYSPGIYPTGL